MSKFRVARVDIVLCLLLAAVTLGLYYQATGFDLTNFDDNLYVQDNPAVQAGVRSETIAWALKSNSLANWHPLTWISLMADTQLAEIGSWMFDMSLGTKNSGFYHFTNVALHLANTLMLFAVLCLMTGRRWPSAFVAALFAVHPLHVESVAWVSERKDVLSTLFWLLTMLAYVRYVKNKEGKGFVLVIAAYALGLMAKPMLVSLPIVLLLLDLWPLGRLQGAGPFDRLRMMEQGTVRSDATPGGRALRLRDLVTEKSPLFGLAVVSCGLTVWAQGAGGAMGDVASYPFGVRLANAMVAYVAYLWKMVWPTGLSFLYLHPGTGLPVWQVVGAGVGLAAATIGAVLAARRWPYVTVGWFWYLVTLVPVIGLVQVGKQAMADRYTYVPLIGIFMLIAWGVPELLRVRTMGRAIALGVAAFGVVLALAMAAYPVVGYWRNSITLCTNAIRVDPKNSLAYNNLGNALLENDDPAGAVRNLSLALRYHPEYTDAHYNLANAFYAQGQVEKAIAQYRYVVKRWPKHAEAHNNLGSVLAQQGKLDEAIAEFETVLRLNPQSESARTNLENARSQKSSLP